MTADESHNVSVGEDTEASAADVAPKNGGKNEADKPSVISKSFDEWLDSLSSSGTDVFRPQTTFQNDEISRLLRVLSFSAALTAATVAIGSLKATTASSLLSDANSLLSNSTCLKIAVEFVYVGLFYRVYSRLFKIRLSLRQSFFCFALVLIPWIPVISALKVVGDQTNALAFEACTYGIFLYLPWAVSRAIALVAEVSKLRALASVLFGAFFVVVSLSLPTLISFFGWAKTQVGK